MVNKELVKNKLYTYRVTWSEEDNEYVGLCAEFPGLSWLADTQEKALKGINQLVADVLVDMQANNEDIPLPLSIKNYSGKFSVRIPPEVHRELAIYAAESKVSFNRYISAKLTSK
jgi:predicted HicB family RNase H-like nuclease